MSIEYFYFGDTAPQSGVSAKIADEFNPQFSLSKEFVDSVSNISSFDLGKRIPYIKLTLVDSKNEDVIDFTKEFFQKSPDLSKPFVNDTQYPNRPDVSLIGIEVTKNRGGVSGAGYLYFSEVVLNLKIHKIEALEGQLKAFLFLGLPFKLVYGWVNGEGALENKETLFFNVQTYSLDFDDTNQITFTVRGMSVKNRLLEVNLADDGTKPDKSAFVGVNAEVEETKEIRDFVINEAKSVEEIKKRFSKSNTSRFEYMSAFKEKYDKLINEFFDKKINPPGETYNEGKNKLPAFKLQDVVSKLLEDAAKGVMKIENVDGVRIIYGQFSDGAGFYKGKNISDFLIPKTRLRDLLMEQGNVKSVLTFGDFLELLQNSFFKQDLYYTVGLPKEERELFSRPDITYDVRVVESGNKKFVDVSIFDVSYGIPDIFDIIKDKKTPEQIRSAIKDQGILILRPGHSTSFFNGLSLNANYDSSMRSVWMSRLYKEKLGGERSTKSDKEEKENLDTPSLRIPLAGSCNFIGSTEWRPNVSIYLSLGSKILDNIYVINSVKHRLSDKEFITSVEFLPTS